MQTFYQECYDDDTALDLNMKKMEANCLALKSNFSGVSPPSGPIGKMWGDETKKILKFLSFDFDSPSEEEWLGIFHADEDSKIYVYRNDALDGYVIDETSSLGDTLVAVQGESADTYNSAGSVQGDSWDETDVFHNHQWYDSRQPSDGDTGWDSANNPTDWLDTSADLLGSRLFYWYLAAGLINSLQDSYTANSGNSNWRPVTSVGTMQYLDLT